MRGNFISAFVFVAVLLWVTVFGASCGNRTAAGLSSKSGGPSSAEQKPGDVVAELNALVKPSGVPNDVWTNLKNAFLKAYDPTREKSIALELPPDVSGEIQEGKLIISWPYNNFGDYDLSGDVGVPDITPIALNYLKLVSSGEPLLPWIDGDTNGEIGVPDVTQIALNYLNQVDGYIVETSSMQNGEYSQSALVGFGDEVGVDRTVIPPRFFITVDPAPIQETWFRVYAFHTEEFGPPSIPIDGTGEPPPSGLYIEEDSLGLQVYNEGVVLGSITVRNSLEGSQDFTVESSEVWLNVTPASGSVDGMGTATIEVSADAMGLAFDRHHAELTLKWSGADDVCDIAFDHAQLNAVVSEDTTLPFLEIKSGETLTIENDAHLTVTGETEIDGSLIGNNSSIWLNLQGDSAISGLVKANLEESYTPRDENQAGILIIAEGGLHIGDNAEFETNGSLIVTDDPEDIPVPDDVEANADTFDSDPLPFIIVPLPDGGMGPMAPPRNPVAIREASQLPPWRFGGIYRYPFPPPSGVRKIVVAIWPKNRDVLVENFELSGPPGRPGEDVEAVGTATGGNGENAFTLNIKVPNNSLTFGANVIVNLGDGGRGGHAIALGNKNAVANGGSGGQPSKFKFSAGTSLNFGGAMNLNPGKGGKGGAAEAYAEDGNAGCPPEDGGFAVATGGEGASVSRSLRARGNVNGLSNVTFGDQKGGDGGDAFAFGGDGGDDTCCPGTKGGKGGDATATGGGGGSSTLSLNLGGNSLANVPAAIGGNGGSGITEAGRGGDGSSCFKQKAGDGGDGGVSNAFYGLGGAGNGPESIPGIDGTTEIDTSGGRGGDGGDGDPFGVGGIGGDFFEGPAGGPAVLVGKGADGEDGIESEMIYWWCGWGWMDPLDNPAPPGPYNVPIFEDPEMMSPTGDMFINLVPAPGCGYFHDLLPVPHIGVTTEFDPAIVQIELHSLQLAGGPLPGRIVDVSLDPLANWDLWNKQPTAQPIQIAVFDEEMNPMVQTTITEIPTEIIQLDLKSVPSEPFRLAIFVPAGWFSAWGPIIICDP